MTTPSKKEINHTIKLIARYNKLLWDTICMAEEISRTEAYAYMRSLDVEKESDIEVLKDLANRFLKATPLDTTFADYELNGATLQDVKDITDMLEEVM